MSADGTTGILPEIIVTAQKVNDNLTILSSDNLVPIGSDGAIWKEWGDHISIDVPGLKSTDPKQLARAQENYARLRAYVVRALGFKRPDTGSQALAIRRLAEAIA